MPQVLEIFSCGRQTCWTDLTYPTPRLLISYQCKESELSVFRRENVMGLAVWPCTLTLNLLKCYAWQYCFSWLSHNCMINWYRSAADTMAYIWHWTISKQYHIDKTQDRSIWFWYSWSHFEIFFYNFPLLGEFSELICFWTTLAKLWPSSCHKMTENGGFWPISEKVSLCGIMITQSISNMVFTLGVVQYTDISVYHNTQLSRYVSWNKKNVSQYVLSSYIILCIL